MRREPPAPPQRTGRSDGLAYALFVPDRPTGGVLVLHGAGSCKESHFDFARAARAHGLAALAFDQRGHGDSEGVLDGRMVDDAVAMAGLLRAECGGPVALRGSSMGGCVALLAAPASRARAVVAICPAPPEGLVRGLRAGAFQFECDRPALETLLGAADLDAAIAASSADLLLLHAEGDEQVPIAHSRALHAAAPGSRLIAVPGGHHRSIQHDPELQGESLRFIARAFAAG